MTGVRTVSTGFAAYCCVLGAAALWRWHEWTYGTDTGLFGQAIAAALHGQPNGPEEGSHYRFHWAPLLTLLWPLVALTRTPLVLQFAQAIVIGSTVWPLFFLARRYTNARIASALATLALLYPPLVAVAFTEFHEIAFYPVIVIGLFWAADRGRWTVFATLAVASALVREEACLTFVFAGIALAAIGLRALRSRTTDASTRGRAGLLFGESEEPRKLVAAGLGLTSVNLAAFALYYLVVTPRFGGWEPTVFYSFPFATGPVATVIGLLVHPANFRYVLTFGRLTYLLEAFLPLAFLPLFSRWSLLALPGFAVVLLSSYGIVWRMGSHYAAIWIPWLLIGIVAAFAGWYRTRETKRITFGLRAAKAICIVVLLAFDPLHPFHYARAAYRIGPDVRDALATVPRDARVATHDEWFTHVALDHPQATVFFCPYVDYVVYADDYPNGYYQDQIVPEVHAELRSGQMREIRRFGKVAVYARTPDRGAKYGRCVTARPEGFTTLRQFLDADLRRE